MAEAMGLISACDILNASVHESYEYAALLPNPDLNSLPYLANRSLAKVESLRALFPKSEAAARLTTRSLAHSRIL